MIKKDSVILRYNIILSNDISSSRRTPPSRGLEGATSAVARRVEKKPPQPSQLLLLLVVLLRACGHTGPQHSEHISSSAGVACPWPVASPADWRAPPSPPPGRRHGPRDSAAWRGEARCSASRFRECEPVRLTEKSLPVVVALFDVSAHRLRDGRRRACDCSVGHSVALHANCDRGGQELTQEFNTWN